MKNNIDYYTISIGKIYEKQGYYDDAIKIYEHLLDQEPANENIKYALENIKKKIGENNKYKLNKVSQLFKQWFELLFKYSKIKKLKKMNIPK